MYPPDPTDQPDSTISSGFSSVEVGAETGVPEDESGSVRWSCRIGSAVCEELLSAPLESVPSCNNPELYRVSVIAARSETTATRPTITWANDGPRLLADVAGDASGFPGALVLVYVGHPGKHAREQVPQHAADGSLRSIVRPSSR